MRSRVSKPAFAMARLRYGKHPAKRCPRYPQRSRNERARKGNSTRVQSRRPCGVELGSGAGSRNDHEEAYLGNHIEGVHGPRFKEEPQYEIKSDTTDHLAM